MLITIRDTGHGMTEEVKQQIFDPCYTTKERGHGLGLASQAAAVPACESKALNILVIDDERMVGELCSDLLAGDGHLITVESEPLVGLDHYARQWKSIDLVILDIDMPAWSIEFRSPGQQRRGENLSATR